MQLAVNRPLVRNRARLAGILYAASVVVFLAGWWLSIQADPTEVPWPIFPLLMGGLVLLFASQAELRRWGPRQRQEELLGHAIKGLDDRYKLYAYLTASLPDYILVSPAGVQVLVARSDGGDVTCERDRWRKGGWSFLTSFFGTPLGNPTHDAQRNLEKVQRLLAAEGYADVPTSALVVFTNPRVRLRNEGCSVTVTRARELRDVLRRASGKGTRVALSAARVRELQAFFDRRMETAGAWR